MVPHGPSSASCEAPAVQVSIFEPNHFKTPMAERLVTGLERTFAALPDETKEKYGEEMGRRLSHEAGQLDCDLVDDQLYQPRPPPSPGNQYVLVGDNYVLARPPPPLAAGNPPQTPPPTARTSSAIL